MMRNFVALVAFAAGSNALVGRGDSCCFHLTSSGGASGKLGQLGDGQNRIGDSSLSTAKYCIDSKGDITDGKGRGCILTPPTTQFQCDEGASPTSGFSIGPKGELEYHGSKDFVACATGQNGGMNVYTTPNKTDVTGCVNVALSADSCSNSGSSSGTGPGASSSAGPQPSGASAPGAQSTPAGSAPAPGFTPGTGTGTGGQPGGQSGGPAPSGAAGSPLPGSTQTLLTTVTVTLTDCSCAASGAPGGPGAVGGGAQPSAGKPAPSGGTGHQPSGPGPLPGGGAPKPAGSATAPAPAVGGGGGAQPTGSASAPAPVVGGGGGAQPTGSAPAPIPGVGGGGGTQPAGTASVPPVGGGASTHPAGSASVPGPAGGGSASQPTGFTSVPAPPGGGGGAHSTGSASVSAPPVGGGGGHPTGSSSASVPGSSASTSPSGTGSATGACPTTLESGNYEFPHLIVSVDSSSPDHAAGTSFNATVTSTISTIFNFDIPSSDAGKTCSLVFLFPHLQDLETSSYSFSGDGKIDFSKLSSVAKDTTSFSNVPSLSQDLGTMTVSPGNSYLVSTFACPAGEAVAYEMKNAGSTDLNFFEDWNPSPLGLYITTC
ncbi:GPI anchored cell wall protein [Penicillium paradoxum]|uniref:GPI anchored cell wall protein n=1 Tax=Penicillium paradoxum TaxID=176176 RepID=UPI0025496F96|nr:GPI anchored cell wall protein [Penicillium paradoxum]KAJ5774110.1 GPI anchored cell wall protein [Penicillium paradoxum]